MMGEGDSKEGFIIDLLDEMEINYEIVSPEDRKYGRLENGKWTGMMGMLINGVIFTLFLKFLLKIPQFSTMNMSKMVPHAFNNFIFQISVRIFNQKTTKIGKNVQIFQIFFFVFLES